jgi:hypothetical protein
MPSPGILGRVALVTSQNTAFFIVTAVKTSNLTEGQQFPCKNRIVDNLWWPLRPKHVESNLLNNSTWF